MSPTLRRFLGQTERLVDALTPSAPYEGQHTQTQYRLLVYISLITIFFSLQYMLVSWVIGFVVGVWLEAGCFVAHIALLFFFRRYQFDDAAGRNGHCALRFAPGGRPVTGMCKFCDGDFTTFGSSALLKLAE